MTIESIFPTPIYYSGVEVYSLDDITKEIDDALDKTEFSYRSDWGKTHHLSDTTFKQNFIVDNALDTLQDEIRHHILVYLANVACPKPREYDITSSWVSLFKPGDYGHIHTHGYYDISGVYYHSTNGEDGDLFFNSPDTNLSTSYCFEQASWPWIHSPQKGKISLFPSWVPHGIQTNETDSDRVSISFNITFNNRI